MPETMQPVDASFEQSRDGFTVSTDRARLDLDLIHRFLVEESYWAAGVPRAIVERAIAHSLPFGLYGPEGRQIGFARVTTDYATYGYLQDVFVLGSRRGQGLGTFLIEAVFAHPELQGFRRWTLATRDAHGLYAQYGFTPHVDPRRFMERYRPDPYRSQD